MFTGLLWQIVAGGLAVTLVGVGMKTCSQDRELLKAKNAYSELDSTLNGERAASAAKLATAEGRTRATEQSLQETADAARKEKNELQKFYGNQHATLSERVRLAELKARSAADNLYGLSSTPKTSSVGQITIRDPDALVLGTYGQEDVDEALRADTIRIAILGCYKQYSDAETKLNLMGKTPVETKPTP